MISRSTELCAEQRIQDALWEGAMTRMVRLGAGAIESTSACLDSCFPSETIRSKSVIVVADSNTYRVAGEKVCKNLRQGGRKILDPYIFEDGDLYAEYRFVERLQNILAKVDAIPIAVGAGTINDLTKLAAHHCGRPYLVVGTAASMDGYTAFGASITKDGYKQTFSCPAPLAAVIDLEVIAAAPAEMNAAGYADLLAKVPAGADWLLADAVGAEAIDSTSWKLVQDNLREWLKDPAGVRKGDPAALAGLAEGLIMTGLGMQRSNSSRPASGADHQFSHLWDMQHHTHRGVAPMHGCKVAIGTLASSAAYERVLAADVKDLATDEALVGTRWPEWELIERAIHNDFPDPLLAEQVVRQSQSKYLPAAEVVSRLRRLKENWPSLCSRLREQLLPAAELRNMLARVGAPHSPEEIGISRDRLRESYRQAQWIRSRYTILDLVLEAGWWTQCIDSLFEPGGFWRSDTDVLTTA